MCRYLPIWPNLHIAPLPTTYATLPPELTKWWIDVFIPLFVAQSTSIFTLSPEIIRFWPPTIFRWCWRPFLAPLWTPTNPLAINCSKNPMLMVLEVGASVYNYMGKIARMGWVPNRPRQVMHLNPVSKEGVRIATIEIRISDSDLPDRFVISFLNRWLFHVSDLEWAFVGITVVTYPSELQHQLR